jgi:mRNA-degrading endonuclease RelE of RelBE toxin-antitoxin system
MIPEIKATHKFMQLAKRAITPEALQELTDFLTLNPEKGIIIAGTGEIRKLRWRNGKDNKGKSGGVRIFYYYDNKTLIILLITLFKKSDKENIDSGEKQS